MALVDLRVSCQKVAPLHSASLFVTPPLASTTMCMMLPS